MVPALPTFPVLLDGLLIFVGFFFTIKSRLYITTAHQCAGVDKDVTDLEVEQLILLYNIIDVNFTFQEKCF